MEWEVRQALSVQTEESDMMLSQYAKDYFPVLFTEVKNLRELCNQLFETNQALLAGSPKPKNEENQATIPVPGALPFQK